MAQVQRVRVLRREVDSEGHLMPRPRLPPEAVRVRLDLTLPRGLVEFLTTLATAAGVSRSEIVSRLVEAERRRVQHR